MRTDSAQWWALPGSLAMALLLAVATPSLARAMPADGFSQCLTALAEQPPEETVQLAEHCPELYRALHTEDVAHALPLDPDRPQTIAQLRKAKPLFLEHQPIRTLTLERARLERIVTALGFDPQESAGERLWNRFATWLESLFPTFDPSEDGLLQRVAEALAALAPAARAMAYLLGPLLAGLLLWMLWRFRHHLRWRRPELTRWARDEPLRAATPASELHGVRELPEPDQPGALLGYCLESLRRRELLPPTRGLSNGECQRLLQCRDPQLAGVLRALCLTVEQALYGRQPLSAAELSDCFDMAVRLDTEAGQ